MNHYEPPHGSTKTACLGQYLSEFLDGFARNLHEVGLTFRDDRNEG